MVPVRTSVPLGRSRRDPGKSNQSHSDHRPDDGRQTMDVAQHQQQAGCPDRQSPTGTGTPAHRAAAQTHDRKACGQAEVGDRVSRSNRLPRQGSKLIHHPSGEKQEQPTPPTPQALGDAAHREEAHDVEDASCHTPILHKKRRKDSPPLTCKDGARISSEQHQNRWMQELDRSRGGDRKRCRQRRPRYPTSSPLFTGECEPNLCPRRQPSTRDGSIQRSNIKDRNVTRHRGSPSPQRTSGSPPSTGAGSPSRSDAFLGSRKALQIQRNASVSGPPRKPESKSIGGAHKLVFQPLATHVSPDGLPKQVFQTPSSTSPSGTRRGPPSAARPTLLSRRKPHRSRIHAVPQASRWWPVMKHVSQVSFAPRAPHLRSLHTEGPV